MSELKNPKTQLQQFETTPFSAVYIADYYDGFLEGLAFRSDIKSFCLIRKVWWVEGSYPRLFRWQEIDINSFPLENNLADLLAKNYSKLTFIERYPSFKSEYEEVKKYFDEAALNENNFYCFCNSIFGPITLIKEEGLGGFSQKGSESV